MLKAGWVRLETSGFLEEGVDPLPDSPVGECEELLPTRELVDDPAGEKTLFREKVEDRFSGAILESESADCTQQPSKKQQQQERYTYCPKNNPL